MSAVHEQPVIIQGMLPAPMLGVLTMPHGGTPPSGIGVVIVNGGAQYRAGAHRMFVQLARHLSEQGHAVLRFDFPGQGDSPGEPVGFEDTAPHIAASLDALHQLASGIKATALVGLCDGASASLLYLDTTKDPRITHLALINPWVHNPQTEARAQVKHYYLQRLRMPDFWRKLLCGGVRFSAVGEWLRKLVMSLGPEPEPSGKLRFQDRMASAWHAHQGPIVLILSESDQTAQEFMEHTRASAPWASWDKRPRLKTLLAPAADHTLSGERDFTLLRSTLHRFFVGTESMTST